MKRFVAVIVLVLLMTTASNAFAKSINQEEAAVILVYELDKKGLWKEEQTLIYEGTNTIDGEEYWYFRHAEKHPTHIVVLNHYFVNSEGVVYSYDVITDEYTRIN